MRGCVAQGSSPLTRGKRGWRRKGLDLRRLIPAHAGKTRRLVGRLRLLRAHPRSRGENARADDNGSVCLGSSPLTRGKRPHLHVRVFDHGLIPAHAGKTGQGARPSGPWRAHPRSRGENQNGEDTTPPKKGSSPLTRGKLVVEHYVAVKLGLIPAHAGKTRPDVSLSDRERAHPRSRGENFGVELAKLCAQGSSPLTRGKPKGGRHEQLRMGLIPAHAGKTAGV